MSTHPIKADISRQIKQLRARTGYTQAGLAEAIHTGQSNVAKWEDPRKDLPTVQTLLNIAEVFGVELEIKFVEKTNG
tara:strand:- start:597 stop:827 length:231 start_codon:yes stop_codon:yes gene_type:complete